MRDETHPYQPENPPAKAADKTAAEWRAKLVVAENGMIDVQATVASFIRDESHVAIRHFEAGLRRYFMDKPGNRRSQGIATCANFLMVLYHTISPLPTAIPSKP